MSLIVPGSADALMYQRAQQELAAPSEHSLSRWASSQSLLRADDTQDVDAKGLARALQCYHEDEEFLSKEKIAEWLGSQ
jgi:PH/SEC7 domain-containing protein